LARDVQIEGLGPGGITDIPWGTHLCLFYETKKEFLELTVPYLKAGIEANEFCLWAIPDYVSGHEARAALSEVCSKYDRVTLQILSAREFYGTGNFDRLGTFFENLVTAALANGFNGVRGCGDGHWLEEPDWKQFGIFEMGGNAGRPATKLKLKGLCCYPLFASRAGDLADMAVAHQHTITKRKSEWVTVDPATFAAIDVSEAVKRTAALSPRERQVLEGLLAGHDKRRLASDMGITTRTVESHRARMLDRLKVGTFAEAARIGALAKSAASSAVSPI